MERIAIIAFSLVLLVMIGCSNQTEQKELSALPEPNVKTEDIQDDFFEAELLDSIVNVRVTFFSNTTSADTFRLVVPAGKIYGGNATFTIVNEGGDVLFQQTFESNLIGNGYNLPDNPTKEDKVLLTQNRANTFFEDSWFEKAIDNEFIRDADTLAFLDFKVWDEVKSIPNHQLYIFCLREEDCNYLVYSPSLNKVVSIIGCC